MPNLKENNHTVDNNHYSIEEEENGYLPLDPNFATRAIHVGQDPDKWSSGIVIPPIHMGTTFKQDAAGKHRVSSDKIIALYIFPN